MGGKHILEKMLEMNPNAEIWWDSSPLVYENWARGMVEKAPEGKKERWSEQLKRLFDPDNPGATYFRGVTTNPPLSLNAIKDNPQFWAKFVKDQMVAHPEWWGHRPFEDAPHFPNHLERFGGLVKQGKVRANAWKYRWAPLGHTMDYVLRMGESFTRYWRADSTRYYKGWWGRSDKAGEWLRKNVAGQPEHMYTHKQKGEYGSIYDRSSPIRVPS